MIVHLIFNLKTYIQAYIYHPKKTKFIRIINYNIEYKIYQYVVESQTIMFYIKISI